MRLNFKLFIFIIFSLLSFSIQTQAQNIPFNKIIFFGDSLSDNGNLYGFDLGFLPKSPPYFEGRFSNGAVWAENVADYFSNKISINSINYAVGGETAVFHNPRNGYLPYSLTVSVNSYLLHSIFSDRTSSLFVVWIGANDYLKGTTDIEGITNNVILSIQSAINRLIYYGGLNFLIINLPDLSLTPFGKTSDMSAILSACIFLHNAKLDAIVTQIQSDYPGVNIHLFDVNKMFTKLIADPQNYNNKYKMHITNTTSSCWLGGYRIRNNMLAQKIREKIKSNYQFSSINNNNEILKIDGLTSYIDNSPALRETYLTAEDAENGLEPCKNPDEFVFWDHIHPTTIIHTMLSKKIIEFIEKNFVT